MKIKFGQDDGNVGAIIRWGKYLDNGFWIRPLKYRKMWATQKWDRGYFDVGVFIFRWGN